MDQARSQDVASGDPRIDEIDLEAMRPSLDRIVRVALTLFGAATGEVSVRRNGRVWRVSGRSDAEAPLLDLIEAARDVVWIENVATDPRHAGLPLSEAVSQYAFFAGAPIALADGQFLGALMVADHAPRPFNERLARRLTDLADLIADDWQRHLAVLARARAEAEATAARATLALVVETSPVALVMTDRDMGIIQASQRWRRERRLEDVEIVGRSMYDLFPQARAQWSEAFDRALAGEAVHGDKVRMNLRDGSQRWLRTEHSPWRDAAGEIGGVMLMSVDITDMVEALEAAKTSEQRLQLAVEIGDLFVWEADYGKQAVTEAGAASPLDYGKPMDFADIEQEETIWNIIHPNDRPAAMAAWDRHMEDGETWRAEFRMLQLNGPHRWAQAAGKAILDDTGEVARIIGVTRDIDARKRGEIALAKARDAAEAANQAKSEFLANMSHEIRTPLNGVMGVASALGRTALSEPQREMVGLIESSAQTLAALLSDVLDLARIEAGHLSLRIEPFDLRRAVEDVGALFEPSARNKTLDFAVQITPAADGVFLGDAPRLRQILSNLVSNAVKFTERGSVCISADAVVEAGRDILVLGVTDTGIGFDAEAAARLFNRFEQADGSITRRYGGTGLGLAISRSLAHAMDAELSTTSGPGRGSTFTLRVPLRRSDLPSPSTSSDAGPEEPAVDLSRFSVLLAEDHPTNRRVVELILESAGVELTCVENGADAVAAWEGRPFDLILMDMQMPVMDGLTATRTIREREAQRDRPATLIYALTANAMPEHAQASTDAGADGHLTKPISAEALFGAVRQAAVVRSRATPRRIA